MDFENYPAVNGLWSLTSNTFLTMESYLVLHKKISMQAYKYTGELEAAKDIASECLIGWWLQHCNEEQAQQVKICNNETVTVIIESVKNCTKRRRLSEHCFVQEQMIRIPAYKTFMIAEREIVLPFLKVLQPIEQTVIRLILIDELDLPEISIIVKKTVPALKILRDRSAVLLRKTFLKAGVCK